MTKSQLQNRVNYLVFQTLSANGQLDVTKAVAVFGAISQSKLTDKMILLRQFVRKIALVEKYQQAIITTPLELDDKNKNEITELVYQKHPAMATIVWRLDPALLGGITIQAGDTWYDMSIQNRLHTIEEQLG